jgi:AraC-like DNA-binding protein
VANPFSCYFLPNCCLQMPQRSSTQRSITQLAGLLGAQGILTRLAADRARRAGIKLEPLLSRAGLTVDQINDPEQRISVRKQIAFLEVAAEELNDDFLGLTLASEADCRDLGLLYYVMASSDTLGEALKSVARYSRIVNEAIVFQYLGGLQPSQRVTYSGIPRHADRHQMEASIVGEVRIARLLTGRQFVPKRVSMVHVRSGSISKLAHYLGEDIEFGSDVDEIVFPTNSAKWPLVEPDTRLNKILVKVCEETLSTHESNTSAFRTEVENIISSLLPHGHARAEIVARKLGVSERTLARRLAKEGVTFIEVLQQLKASLATRYLDEGQMPISKIAWLLGFEEVSSFSHACRRWLGKSPRELRSP